MRHAFSTLGCPELGLDAVLAVARRHGVAAVELRALEGSLDLPATLEAMFGEPARIERDDVRVVSLGTSVRLMSPEPGDRASLLAHVPWAEAFGAASLRVFDGGARLDFAELGHARDLLSWWRDARAESGWSVDLAIETHDALAQPEALARFIAEVPHAALLWDAHHTWRKGGEHPVRTWGRVRGRTAHIHVKDSSSLPGPRLPYSYVLPGQGEFPMAELRAALDDSAYAGVLSLEWERLWHPDLPPLEQALEAAAAWW